MQDDNNRKNILFPSDSSISDDLKDALAEADDVIAEALRRKELEEAIAETDREVAELAAQRKQTGTSGKKAGSTAPIQKNNTAGSTGSGSASSSKVTEENVADQKPLPADDFEDDLWPEDIPSAEDIPEETVQKSPSRTKKFSGNNRFGLGKKVLIGLLLLCAAVVSVFLIRKYTPTNKRMSYTEYFGTMAEDEAAIVLQDHIAQERALIQDGDSVYLPYEFVRGSLNERFYWDETLHDLIFTTPLQTYEIPINSTSYTVIDGALTSDPTSEASYKEVILLRKEDSSDLYLSMDFISEYTNVTCSFEKETQHIYLRNKWGDTLSATAAKDAAVRYAGGIKSPILTDLNKGDRVMVLSQTDHWLQVLTLDGFIGYVKSNRMSQPADVNILNEGFTPQEYTSAAPDEKISVVWHMITTKDGNSTFEDATSAMTGVSAISPTWFSLSSNDGDVDSKASAGYVKKAHAKGLQVWGLVDDFSSGMDTSAMLASTSARRNCIGQLIGFAKELKLDGINIDFEYVEEADGLCYSQFLRELSIACRRENLILSVDLVPPYDFNAYLNRLEIASVCDYLINMGYDEHYAGGDAGSVASLPFEESAILNLLAMGIPAEKIISAVPFYTRIWYTSSDGSGNTYVSSEELSMRAVSNTVDSWKLTPTWDAEAAQEYVGWYTDDGVLCEIWIENAKSLQRKVLLTSKYDLGGTAIWVLGFETDSIWETITDSMEKTPEEAAALETQLIGEMASSVGTGSQTEAEEPGV